VLAKKAKVRSHFWSLTKESRECEDDDEDDEEEKEVVEEETEAEKWESRSGWWRQLIEGLKKNVRQRQMHFPILTCTLFI